MRLMVALLCSALVAACALPETSVRTGSPRPAVYVKGAPEGSLLFVDGLAMGAASRYNGNPQTLLVEEGVHVVDVVLNNQLLHTEKVFVGNGETRGVSVNAGGF